VESAPDPPITGSLLEEVLETLDLARAEPGIGLLEALFSRFNARVPFETASKIERHALVVDQQEKPRFPEIFWREHVERGTGGTCFERVAAFEALLVALGFESRKILGRVSKDFDHAALLVGLGGLSRVCDVGFPFPALLPAAPGETETALGHVRVRETPRGLLVDLDGVPEGPRRVELFLAPLAEGRFLELWRGTFRSDSKFLKAVTLRQQLDNRAVSFAAGEARVDDLHSRLTVPLAAPRAARLSQIFGVDADLLSRAFARVGDPEPRGPDATLTAYLGVAETPARAFAAIASPERYRRLLEGVAEISVLEQTPEGWSLRLSPAEAPPAGAASFLEERVVPDAAARRIHVERSSGSARSDSFFDVIERSGECFLRRGVRLSGAREDLLRNDSLRGRLAGTLAVDLLAWARILAS